MIDLKRLVRNGDVYAAVGACAGEPLLIQDLNGAILFGDPATAQPERYPIRLEGETIGWVAGQSRAPAAATVLSLIVRQEQEKRVLARETLAKYRELSLLYDITEKLGAGLDPREVAQLILHEARPVIRTDNVSLMLINAETGVLEVVAGLGEESDHKMRLRVGEGIAGSVALTGKAEIVNDAPSDPRYVYSGRRISSIMCAPLRMKDRIIGVINVSSREPMAYSAEDLKVLTSLSLQAAAAVENARLYESLKETFLTVVYTLAETIEKRDPYTGGHTRRVMEYSVAIGQALGLPEADMERLRLASVLHDVGKIGIRDSILLKPGPLDDEEFREIKKHTLYGEEVLKFIKYFREIIPGVRHHHERFDGRGYPDGLKGEEIDPIARIIAVADAFDAMTSDRPYRKGLGREAAFAEIRRNAGTQFDPAVVQAFLQTMVT